MFPPHVYQAHEPTTEMVNFCVCCVSVLPHGSICDGPRGGCHCRPWADAKEIIPFGILNPPVFWASELLSWDFPQWEPGVCNPSWRKWGDFPVFCWVWTSLGNEFTKEELCTLHYLLSTPCAGFMHHLCQPGMHLQTQLKGGDSPALMHSSTASRSASSWCLEWRGSLIQQIRMCFSLDGSDWGAEPKFFRPIFILFSILRIGKFSDCLNLVNTKSLLNHCGFEDKFCACREEAFPVELDFFFLVKVGNYWSHHDWQNVSMNISPFILIEASFLTVSPWHLHPMFLLVENLAGNINIQYLWAKQYLFPGSQGRTQKWMWS